MNAPSKPKLSRSELLGRLKEVTLLSLDVDGVLTDGKLYYTDDGQHLRKFSVRDGVGVKRALAAGIEVAFVSAGTTPSIRHRGETLGVRHVFIGVQDKLATITDLGRKLGTDLVQVAHMGDDLNDLPLLEAVGCPLAVADAVPEVRDAALFVTEKVGGGGAVREICDLLVASRTR